MAKNGLVKLFTLVLFSLMAIGLSGCLPQIPAAPTQPVQVTEPASTAVTQAPAPAASAEPAIETAPAATQAPAGPESNIILLIPEDPSAFNGTVSDTGYNQLVMKLVLLGMARIDPQGQAFPELAAELPTRENGGVAVDQEKGTMDVTWKMRQDVQWADGKPVTADDVVFTWNAISNPDTGIWVEGLDETDGVEKVDDYTFTVHYKSIYPSYLTQFGGENMAIFAAHYCDATQGFTAWNCNREPLSDGPYLLQDWQTGDHLTFVRNPKYYQKGKPYIDEIIIKIVPEKSVEKTMLAQGDADVVMWVTETMIPDLQDKPDVKISFAPSSRWVMRLFPNLAAKGTTDPEASPHPVLSDVRVRQAIRQAIDVDSIITSVWHGYPKPVWTEFFRAPYACDVTRPQYDPQAANALLEQAGWKDQDGDGVRECHGCLNAQEGYKMSMELMTYSEYGEELELTQQLIGEMLKKVGIDTNLSMTEGAIMWADSSSGGLEQTGNFDLNLWDDGYPGVDPTDYMVYMYSSDSATPDNGWNVGRWKNSDFDALITDLYSLDENMRKDTFCKMAKILDEQLPLITLFSTVNADAYSTRLDGIQSSSNDVVTWNVADWEIVQ